MVDKALLTKPFEAEAIKIREGKFRYVEGHTVIHRLNDATDNQWSAEIKEFQMRPWGKSSKGTPAWLVCCHVSLTIPELGTRDSVGIQVVYEGAGEDLVKGAETDGLKKAATKFGVGLELYGPDYAEEHGPDRVSTGQWNEIVALGRKVFQKREQMTAFLVELVGTANAAQMTWEQGEAVLEELLHRAPKVKAVYPSKSVGQWKQDIAAVAGEGAS